MSMVNLLFIFVARLFATRWHSDIYLSPNGNI